MPSFPDPPRRSSGAINRSPGSTPLPSLIPDARVSFPRIRGVFSTRTGHRHGVCVCTHVQSAATVFQFSRSRRKEDPPRAQVSRGEDSRRRFPGKSDAREYRFSAACEIAFGVLFPLPLSSCRPISLGCNGPFLPSPPQRWKRRRCSDTRYGRTGK